MILKTAVWVLWFHLFTKFRIFFFAIQSNCSWPLLLGIGDPKGMPLYLTTNEPSSLHPLLWLFKYSFVGVSKTIWKCNYHVFHLHKYIRDGFIYVLRYVILSWFFSPRIFLFSADISGAKKVMLYFQFPSIKENLEKMCIYPRAPFSQALANDSLLFTRGFCLMWSRCWNIWTAL